MMQSVDNGASIEGCGRSIVRVMSHPFAGRYDLHEQIGVGGMGSVWCAWDHKHAQWVAVKVLTQSEAGTLLRFVREQSLRVQHPHVVAPRGWAADDDHIALSMDLVRGGSLETLLGDHGPLPDSYVAVLVDQLLQGLCAIHEAGVVHRDIKPANVLLEPTGSGRPFARVSDFGVATRVGEPRLTGRGHHVGTPGYLAPEAATADPAPAADLYAVGVLGRRLLTAADPDALPAENPSALWPLLQQLSATDPRRRPRSAAEARTLLAPYLPSGQPWTDDAEPPYVFDQLAAPAPTDTPTQVVASGVTGAMTRASVTAPGTMRRLSPGQLRAMMAASLTLAAILLVIVLVLLLR